MNSLETFQKEAPEVAKAFICLRNIHRTNEKIYLYRMD